MKRAAMLGMFCLLAMYGCGRPQSLGQKEIPLPKQPPPPPPRVEVPLNQPLRELSRKEIREAFASSDPLIRANAIEAAQDTFTPAEAQDMVAAGLKDQEAIVRFASAMAVGEMPLRPLGNLLWGMIYDDSPKVRIGVRFALHKLGDTRLSHDFEKTALDPDPRVREDTAFALGLLGEKSGIKVLQHMQSDPDGGVRIAVAEAMWRLGDERGLEVLEAGSVSQFLDDRMLSIMGLAGPKDQRVEEVLRARLTDDYIEIPLVAARAMGQLGLDDGYTVAMNSLHSTDPRQRYLAALALGAIGRSDAQTALAPLLKDADARVRLAAATALLQIKPPA
jgi:HEAT repeat protein